LADGLLLVRRIREAESNRRPNVFQQACLLLIETSASISEIANACGFEDEFYFSRCFRRQFGSPPRTYRKEHLIRSGRAR
jgi:AraC-like DNA-binding protein